MQDFVTLENAGVVIGTCIVRQNKRRGYNERTMQMILTRTC